MQARRSIGGSLTMLGLVASASAVTLPALAAEPALRAAVTIDGAKRFQRIDGFGVNVTPPSGGRRPEAHPRPPGRRPRHLARPPRLLGKAGWLDREAWADGRWPEAYLAEVYLSPCSPTLGHLPAPDDERATCTST